MSESLSGIEPVYLADDILEKDMFCSRCGYNLRGLTLESLCPECAFPATRSIYGNVLLYADPAWISKIRLGIFIKLLNLLIVVIISYGIENLFFANLPQVLLSMLKFVSGCVGLAAVFLITTSELNISEKENWYTLSLMIRLIVIITFIADQALQAAQCWNVTWYLIEFDLFVSALTTVVLVGVFVYLRRLARRTQNNKLVFHTTIVMWGMALSRVLLLILSIVGVIIGYWMGNYISPDQRYILEIVYEVAEGINVLSLCSLGVFVIWEFVLLIQYIREFDIANEKH